VQRTNTKEVEQEDTETNENLLFQVHILRGFGWNCLHLMSWLAREIVQVLSSSEVLQEAGEGRSQISTETVGPGC
jgi:hypothetical protein